MKRSVREMALIPPRPSSPLLLRRRRRRHPSFKIKNSPNRARGEERRGGRKKESGHEWLTVGAYCLFFSLLHVSSSSSLRASRHNHTNKTSKMDRELKYAAGNYSDCSGMAGEKNTPPHPPPQSVRLDEIKTARYRETRTPRRRRVRLVGAVVAFLIKIILILVAGTFGSSWSSCQGSAGWGGGPSSSFSQFYNSLVTGMRAVASRWEPRRPAGRWWNVTPGRGRTCVTLFSSSTST